MKDKLFKAIIIWETRTGTTSSIALEIQEVLQEAGIEVTAKRILVAEEEGYDLIGALKDANAVVLGSPTYNHDIISPMKDFLVEMEKTELKGKFGAAFGAYGWSGEAVQMLTDTMKNIFKMNVIEPGLKLTERPSGSTLEECKKFARKIAAKIKA